MNATTVAATPAPSVDVIMALGTWFRASKVLLSAVEVGLFTELARGPLDRETLRQRVGLHERSSTVSIRWLRSVSSSGATAATPCGGRVR